MSIEDRLAALEGDVADLRAFATDIHTLAAHADRDVASFRAEQLSQTRLLRAVRADQVEQGAQIRELKAGIAQIVTLLERLAPPEPE